MWHMYELMCLIKHKDCFTITLEFTYTSYMHLVRLDADTIICLRSV